METKKAKARSLNFKDAKIINFFVNSDIRWFTNVLRTISKNNSMTFKESFEYFCYIFTV